MAAGKLPPAELFTRDLGHRRLLLPVCPSLHAATTSGGSRSLAELPGEVSGVALVMAGPACGTWEVAAVAVTPAWGCRWPPVSRHRAPEPSRPRHQKGSFPLLTGRSRAGQTLAFAHRPVAASLVPAFGRVRTGRRRAYCRDISHWCRSPASVARCSGSIMPVVLSAPNTGLRHPHAQTACTPPSPTSWIVVWWSTAMGASQVNDRAAHRPQHAVEGLHPGDHQPARLAGVLYLCPGDDVMRPGHASSLYDARHVPQRRGHSGRHADLGLDENVRGDHLIPTNLLWLFNRHRGQGVIRGRAAGGRPNADARTARCRASPARCPSRRSITRISS